MSESFYAYFIQSHDVAGGRIHYTVIDNLDMLEKSKFITSVLIARSGPVQDEVSEVVRKLAEERYPAVIVSSAVTFTFQLRRHESDKTIAEQLRRMAEKIEREQQVRERMTTAATAMGERAD